MRLLLQLHLLALCLAKLLLKPFDLEVVSIEPPPKPRFLVNATHDVIEQFMGIYRAPGIPTLRKMNELDVLVGTLRAEVQQAYQAYKAEALILMLGRDERLQEVTEKAHYTMAHMKALEDSFDVASNERKARVELMHAQFSDFLVNSVTDEVGNAVRLMMQEMLRALLFTEKLVP